MRILEGAIATSLLISATVGLLAPRLSCAPNVTGRRKVGSDAVFMPADRLSSTEFPSSDICVCYQAEGGTEQKQAQTK